MSKEKNKITADTKQTAKPDGAAQSTQNNGVFLIQRIYTKNISFDAPQLTDMFEKEWKPQLDINIQSSNHPLADHKHEVMLNVTVNGKLDDKIILTMGVNQSGIFTLQNFTQEQVALILGTECLKILFPYAREAMTDLSTRATLAPLYLTAINFDAVYAQQMKKRAESETQV